MKERTKKKMSRFIPISFENFKYEEANKFQILEFQKNPILFIVHPKRNFVAINSITAVFGENETKRALQNARWKVKGCPDLGLAVDDKYGNTFLFLKLTFVAFALTNENLPKAKEFKHWVYEEALPVLMVEKLRQLDH